MLQIYSTTFMTFMRIFARTKLINKPSAKIMQNTAKFNLGAYNAHFNSAGPFTNISS